MILIVRSELPIVSPVYHDGVEIMLMRLRSYICSVNVRDLVEEGCPLGHSRFNTQLTARRIVPWPSGRTKTIDLCVDVLTLDSLACFETFRIDFVIEMPDVFQTDFVVRHLLHELKREMLKFPVAVTKLNDSSFQCGYL